MDISQFLTDKFLDDHIKRPINLHAVIQNLSNKYNIYVDINIIVREKGGV